ncbi:hypothetical protein G7046_g1201 [Stylonectria norvegica]|nr:hypothetical protein G7046_g1201 [Stylonectria norvegica]
MPRDPVDPYLRGRQLRRFYDDQAANDKHGFTRTDIATMEQYCPLKDTKVNELKYPLKWKDNARSIAQARSWWRKKMTEVSPLEQPTAAQIEDVILRPTAEESPPSSLIQTAVQGRNESPSTSLGLSRFLVDSLQSLFRAESALTLPYNSPCVDSTTLAKPKKATLVDSRIDYPLDVWTAREAPPGMASVADPPDLNYSFGCLDMHGRETLSNDVTHDVLSRDQMYNFYRALRIGKMRRYDFPAAEIPERRNRDSITNSNHYQTQIPMGTTTRHDVTHLNTLPPTSYPMIPQYGHLPSSRESRHPPRQRNTTQRQRRDFEEYDFMRGLQNDLDRLRSGGNRAS